MNCKEISCSSFCDYCSSDSATSGRDLLVMYTNAQSIKNKIEDLEDILILLRDVDIVAVAETWISSSQRDYFNLHGYDAVHDTRDISLGVGGGVALYINKRWTSQILKVNSSDQFNATGVNIKFKNTSVT